MPVWHKAAEQWVADGKLTLLGITQEQHPDRCQLISQWKKFDWPIVWDPINSLRSTEVPIIVAIDEHGIVRSTKPRPDTFEQEFLDVTFQDELANETTSGVKIPMKPDLSMLKDRAHRLMTASAWREWADATVLWGSPSDVDNAINAYLQAKQLDPTDADTMFRLGVAYRLRLDSMQRQPTDFQHAVMFWEQALARNPNQYIWRRRIQQFGPRLDKPYSFYDWVEQARRNIKDRGETPVALTINPAGAELAYPSKEFIRDTAAVKSPDPKGEIHRDRELLIQSEVTLVPSRLRPGTPVRVHIAMIPNADVKAHWNNEAAPLKVWIDVPDGWQVSKSLHIVEPPINQVTSTETRRVDFEIQAPANATGTTRLPAYALYYVCEDEDGTCLYRRQDLTIELTTASGSAP